MARLGLRRRREDRLGQPVGLDEPGRQRTPHTVPDSSVLRPARAGEVAAGHALDRDHLGPPDQHRPSGERRLAGERRREVRRIDGQDVVGDRSASRVEPEQRQPGQHPPLVRDRVREDDVERADPVGRDEEEPVLARLVDVADLAARAQLGGTGLIPSPPGASRAGRTRPPRFPRYRCGSNSASSVAASSRLATRRRPPARRGSSPLVPRARGRRLDVLVGLVAREARVHQGQEHGLREDQPPADLEVGSHPVGVDDEPVQHPCQVAEHEREGRWRRGRRSARRTSARCPARATGPRPRARPARSRAARGRARRSARRRPGSACGASPRTPSARGERLLDLPDLGAREVADLGRDLVQGRPGDRQRRHVLGVAVALDRPGSTLPRCGGRGARTRPPRRAGRRTRRSPPRR